MRENYEDHYEDDVEVDVCTCCGRYYSVTQTLIDLWRASFNYRPNDVMPQHCHRCMRGDPPPQEY